MQQQQKNNELDMQGSFNLAYFLAHSHATCLTPFIRTDFGREALGMNGLCALILLLAYGSFTNSAAMWIFLLLWILALLRQRLKGIENRNKGIAIHSRYNGYPWLSFKLFPRTKDETSARGIDGFLCMGMGALLSYVDPPLGWFIGVGGFSLLFVEALIVELRKKRLQAMQDAEIEQRDLAEHYRRGRF